MTRRALSAVAAALTVLTGCGTPVAGGAAATSAPVSAPLRGPVFSSAAGRARTEAALALLHLPPGAVRLSAAPADGLTAPPGTIPAWSVVDDAHWWRVPGTSAQFLSYETTHPPTGFSTDGGGWSSRRLLSMAFAPTAGDDGAEVNSFDLSGQQVGDHVDVRADAQIIIEPVRTAAETIPASVTSAVLRYDLEPVGATPYRQRTLDAGQVQALARTVNVLPTDGYNNGCPMIAEGLITLTLTYGGQPVVVSAGPEWCFDVNIMVGSAQQPLLHGSDAFAQLARELLGLPPAA